ncbi:MAG: TraB/GumN family protein, partial [Ferruginibacter sp.]
GSDYVTEKSFQLYNYEDKLKMALSTEPPVVNSMLYRSYKTRDDFEEDTFLDLYIFQAGRKLGKLSAGVEDFYESEKLVLEAYRDMANEKKKKELDLDGETYSSILQKLQNAYRYGDLDLMDSLDNMIEKSMAFREKFLYKRNNIQADAIDSIVRTRSLFTGVGAAHLPGEKGVIEILRRKGYQLRAVKMTDRDAEQKEAINKLKVAVKFSKQQSEDGFYSVDVPGTLYSLDNNYQELHRNQFADMSNGSYYLVTRFKTYASFIHQSGAISKKIDSVLYEHIPGTIISKKLIYKNGVSCYHISNRTRRGDLQRYQIYITAFEVIVFKMSGKGDYVDGEEAERFFGSIKLKTYEPVAVTFKPAQGGFSVQLPHEPHVLNDHLESDRWEYEAVDKTSGEAYLIMKKSVYQFGFLESDSFDLALMETSFRSGEYFDKQIFRKYLNVGGYPALQVKEKMKNGSYVYALFLIQGPHQYVIAQRTKNGVDKSFTFHKTFRIEPYQYASSIYYQDSFLLMSMNTPVQPDIDNSIRNIIEKTAEDAANGNNSNGYVAYWQKYKNGKFSNKNTGELVNVQMQVYPKYFSIRDTAKFWKEEFQDFLGKGDLVLKDKKWFTRSDGSMGYQITIRDTGSSRMIQRQLLLKGRNMFTLSTIIDTLNNSSTFIKESFASFKPHEKVVEADVYKSRLSLFFSDLFSADSALSKKAKQSIENIYFGPEGSNMLYEAINRISIADKNYFETKTKLIAELGFIKDTLSDNIPVYLKKIYEQTADTSLFQNEAVLALARLKTTKSFEVLKELVMQDPPIFEDDNNYDYFFEHFFDTLALSKNLFPQILQLSTLNDYKSNIIDLLVNLVDSGYLRASDYESFFPGIYIDAKVACKKQQAAEEKVMEANNKLDLNDEDAEEEDYAGSGNSNQLNKQSILLMPFYETNKNVKQYFNRMIQSKDDIVRMNTAVLLLRNGKEVHDSILLSLAADERQRGTLFYKLEKIKKLDKFPAKYSNQLAIARSYMIGESDEIKLDSVVFLKKSTAFIKGNSGLVYFFKYRIKKS